MSAFNPYPGRSKHPKKYPQAPETKKGGDGVDDELELREWDLVRTFEEMDKRARIPNLDAIRAERAKFDVYLRRPATCLKPAATVNPLLPNYIRAYVGARRSKLGSI